MPAAETVAPPASAASERLLIGGRLVAGEGDVVVVENPATEEIVARFAGAGADQIGAAVAAAREAQPGWAALGIAQRVEHLRAFLAEASRRQPDLVELIRQEAGCPIGSPSMVGQVAVPLRQCQDVLDLYLRLPEREDNALPAGERVNHLGAVVQSVKRYVPVGVVAAIAAYNFPLMIGLWKIVPALAAGNAMVLRPSPLTPLATLLLGEIAAAAGLPAGVLNIVADAGHEGGVILSTHPDVDMVTFTGSSDVGARVMAQAAPTMKRLQLELGGKSAQIILPDRLEAAREAAARVVLNHAGQGCVLGTRIFVPQEHKARLMAEMADAVSGVVFGDTADRATTMSPVISAAQRDRCVRYVALAVEAGARIVAGGRPPEGRPRGFFFEPTILDVADNANPAARDEIFGPVVAVIGYRDVDHAVEMANDTPFGLSGYVWGADVRAAIAVAERIRTGTIHVNQSVFSAFVSSGGHRRSGLGRERGVEGFRIYQEIQMMSIAQ